jgi:hypothetical protein
MDSRDELDLRLLNQKGWLDAGKVRLELALFDKRSKQIVSDAGIEAFLEKNKERTPCGEARTDSKGRATLQFQLPSNTAEGSTLVVRATHASRSTDLRFQLKAKPSAKSSAPVSL